MTAPRPTRYPSARRQDPAPMPASLSMSFQAPPPSLDLIPGPDPEGPSEAAPEGQGTRPDSERSRLLERITAGRLPSRTLVAFAVEALGLDCLTTEALKTLNKILQAIEERETC